MNNILFRNPTKEEPNQELEETCMQFLLLGNLQMVVEEILLLEILEKLSKLMQMEKPLETVN